MHILYGVQATGNGHITRARTMAAELNKSGLNIDYIFSGRPDDKLFNMEPFGNYRSFKGLTFATDKGKIRPLKTLSQINVLQFIKDIKNLDLSEYDLVLTDFEPITAWAAKLQKVPCIAIGHQYAFVHNVPTEGKNILTQTIMKAFAPADRYLGVHWNQFDSPILPPLIEPPKNPILYQPQKVLVYLPFDHTSDVIEWLTQTKSHQFYIYCDTDKAEDREHVHIRPYSTINFHKDLSDCSGIISNAGFGLSSEAMQCGKKILVKPLKGQMEQLSNAAALLKLELGDVIHSYNNTILNKWLNKPNPAPINFPNVAKAIVEWIISGQKENELVLAKKLWACVNSTEYRLNRLD